MYTWNRRKSRLNWQKHGISFEEARDFIFEGKNILVAGVAYNKGEKRHAVIGKHKGKYFVGIFSLTEEEEIRIISVRRAREEEKRQAQREGL